MRIVCIWQMWCAFHSDILSSFWMLIWYVTQIDKSPSANVSWLCYFNSEIVGSEWRRWRRMRKNVKKLRKKNKRKVLHDIIDDVWHQLRDACNAMEATACVIFLFLFFFFSLMCDCLWGRESVDLSRTKKLMLVGSVVVIGVVVANLVR